MVEIDCIIVLSIPSCKVEYVDKISRRKCILLNLYCYKWILLTGKYVLDAIYFIREVNFNYFLTLPQIHSPTPFFLIYLKEMHYMIWYIGLISSGWKKYTVCKSSYMMARIFLWSENEMEMLSFPKNLGDVVLE